MTSAGKGNGRSGDRARAETGAAEGLKVRDRIIACATDLLGREGYGALSVSAVCKLADVTAPTLYWHFGNKEGLLAAILKESLRRDAEAFTAIDISKMSRREAFEAYLEALRRIVVSERPNNWVILSSLSEARHAAPEILAIIAEARRRQVDYNAEQLREHWGTRHPDMCVHLWLAYCNYISLLYQDTKSLALTEAALQSFKNAYFLLVGALGEPGAHEAGFAEALPALGYDPVPAKVGARPDPASANAPEATQPPAAPAGAGGNRRGAAKSGTSRAASLKRQQKESSR